MKYLNLSGLTYFLNKIKTYVTSSTYLNSIGISNSDIDNIADDAGYSSGSLPASEDIFITGDIIPNTDNSVDLGASSKNIKMIYTKGITINGTTAGDILTHNASEFAQVGHTHSISDITDLPSVLPIGTYIQFAGSQAPAGFLVCNGGEISRTTYSALFAVIGTTYGSGNGSTTFNLPNLTDRFLQGSTTSGTVKNAGLPNITGFFDGAPGLVVASGAFMLENLNAGNTPAGDAYHGTSFNASRSNSIYGNSATVQPPALTCLICIKY